MLTDTEIKVRGLKARIDKLGDVDAETNMNKIYLIVKRNNCFHGVPWATFKKNNYDT